MSINKSEEDTQSVWRNNNPINKTNTNKKDFPPLPIMINNLPTHINIHSPTSSVSSMTIEKRKKKIIDKVDEFLKNRKIKNSSGNSSAQSHNQLIIDNQMNNITTILHIPLQISIPPTKRINYKQESHTKTSSRYSHDSKLEDMPTRHHH